MRKALEGVPGAHYPVHFSNALLAYRKIVTLKPRKLDSYTIGDLLLGRKKLRRELSSEPGMHALRVAILGGSTTQELADLLELLLLDSGFLPQIYQSAYGRFYEEAVLDPQQLITFSPDIVYIHTGPSELSALSWQVASSEEADASVEAELLRYQQVWQSVQQALPAQIIQSNFALPPTAELGHLDIVLPQGASRFCMQLNAGFAAAAESDPRLLLHDVHRVASTVGLSRWYDAARWFSYKIPVTPEASLALARSLTTIILALYGRSRKVLVLDLDNTLWGGVIGDDGVEKLQIGNETAVAEAYTAFQKYCLALHNRGVLLAVCSKNDEAVAKSGFAHPDSVLRLEHFASFQANWNPKHENILRIAEELNLGLDSFVFLDDNPAERAIVQGQLPSVAVPDIGSDVAQYISTLDGFRYFEPISISQEDRDRASQYRANTERAALQSSFASYGDYLQSLEMSAEIAPFSTVYLDRIAQLTNKTNQFNLTTRRYTLAEMEAVLHDPRYIGLYGRLSDRFGNNGLISVVLGRVEAQHLHLDLWLMSCRVLKRDMEHAMLDVLVEHARFAGVTTLHGYYLPTKKNGVVADHYKQLGFTQTSADPDSLASSWSLDITAYGKQNRHITLLERTHG